MLLIYNAKHEKSPILSHIYHQVPDDFSMRRFEKAEFIPIRVNTKKLFETHLNQTGTHFIRTGQLPLLNISEPTSLSIYGISKAGILQNKSCEERSHVLVSLSRFHTPIVNPKSLSKSYPSTNSKIKQIFNILMLPSSLLKNNLPEQIGDSPRPPYSSPPHRHQSSQHLHPAAHHQPLIHGLNPPSPLPPLVFHSVTGWSTITHVLRIVMVMMVIMMTNTA